MRATNNQVVRLPNRNKLKKLNLKIANVISDQELIQLCLEGKELGYSEIYRRYSKGVFNSIFRLMANTADAEDILQDCFCEVFKDIAKLQKIQSVEGWIKRIAINKSISFLRKKKVFFADIDGIDVADEEDEHSSFIDAKVEDVKWSIEQLPIGFRTVVNLYLLEDIPQEEIAKMLGLSHSTVRSQYHRAKKKIMLDLKDKQYYA